MKKIIIILSILFSFIVLGCGNKEGYIEFETKNIVMEYDSTYEVKYMVFGNVNNINFKVEDESIVTFKNNILTAHSWGETTLTCTYNKNKSIDISVRVLGKGNETFEVGDHSLNEINYNKLKDEIDEFSLQIDKSNYLSINIGMKINDEEYSQKLKAMNDPLYIELEDKDFIKVVALEGNKVFQYTKGSGEKCNRKFLGYLANNDDYEYVEDVDNSDEILETTFDKEKCNVEHKDNVYTIKCYFKDMINESSREEIEDLYQAEGVPLSILYDSVVTMKYIIYEEKVYIGISSTFNHENFDEPLVIEITYEIDLTSFTPRNMLDGSYIFTNPHCFEEAFDNFDFKNKIEMEGREAVYLKFESEKGMISTTAEDVGFELYDINQNLIGESIGGATYGTIPCISIPEKGTYYLVVKNRYDVNKTVNLQFDQYDTVFNNEGIELDKNSSHQGVIEGKYDFEKYFYNNNTSNTYSLRIENTGEKTIYAFNYKNGLDPTIVKIYPEQSKMLDIRPGINEIYICEDFLTASAPGKGYEYSFNSKIVYNSFNGEIIESNIPHEFSLSGLEKRYYYTRLEKGMYSILSEDVYSESIEIVIYDDNGEKIDANLVQYDDLRRLSSYFIIDEDAYYYVGILNRTTGDENMVFNKIEYDTVVDKNNPKTLDINGNIMEGHLEGSQDFEYYVLENNTDKIRVFAISNEYDETLKIVFKQYKGSNAREHHIQANKTKYFAVYPNTAAEFVIVNNYKSSEEVELDYKFKVQELENNNVYGKDNPNIKELTEEFSEEYYMAGYSIPSATFELNIDERGIVQLEFECYEQGMERYFQYDFENEEGVKFEMGETLEPGKYYVKLYGNDHLFGYAKVKYTFLSLEDKDVYVTLNNLDDNTSSGIYNEKIADEQVVRYHFTLEEKTTIYYDMYKVYIYNEDGTLATFPPEPGKTTGTDMQYVDLEPGNYYFITPNISGEIEEYKTQIYIGIKTMERDAPQDFSNMFTLEHNTFYEFEKNYTDDREYTKFEVTEAQKCTIMLENGTGYLYNENFECIGALENNKTMEIELIEGTYYVVVVHLQIGNEKPIVKVNYK